jgi:hypothetical protein
VHVRQNHGERHPKFRKPGSRYDHVHALQVLGRNRDKRRFNRIIRGGNDLDNDRHSRYKRDDGRQRCGCAGRFIRAGIFTNQRFSYDKIQRNGALYLAKVPGS